MELGLEGGILVDGSDQLLRVGFVRIVLRPGPSLFPVRLGFLAALHILERGFDRRGAASSRHAPDFELDLFRSLRCNRELK